MAQIIYTRASRGDIRRLAALLPAVLSGRAPDRLGLAHGFRMRLAFAFLEKVKLAFIEKSRGGTDEAGISWPKLSKAYLAYGRRFGPGEQAALKRGAGLGAANRSAPGGKKGLLTAAQLKRWWQVYARNLAWLAAREPIGEAKGHAAAIAWATLKREGAKTKLEVFGSRQVEILRDTGILFNSLSPGELVDQGPGASYSAPEHQVVAERSGQLLVGTNVPYAAAHHAPKRKGGVVRRLWPEPGRVPAAWLDYFQRVAQTGVIKAIDTLAKEAAA